MLTTLFYQLLNMSLAASVVILAVLLARLALRGVPAVFSYLLWAVVLFRLLCPASLPGPVTPASHVESLLPSAETLLVPPLSQDPQPAAAAVDLLPWLWLLGVAALGL